MEGSTKQSTLSQSVARLNELSWRLNGLVFGEKPEKAGQAIESSSSKITSLQSMVDDVNERIIQGRKKCEHINWFYDKDIIRCFYCKEILNKAVYTKPNW